MIAWIGNVLLLIGLLLTGAKRPVGWLFTAIGEIAYVVYAVTREDLPLGAICLVFFIIALHNYTVWRIDATNKM